MENNKDLYVNFEEMLNDTRIIKDILNCIDPENLEVENIISSYEKNNNRFGVIFMAMNYKLEESQKIIIDSINGEPNSNQVKELTYDQGADCDKRIILYTLVNPNYTKNEFWYEKEMMEGLAKVNNDISFETFLVYVSLKSDKTYKYSAEIYPDGKRLTSLKKLPTKHEFEKAVFRVFYNQTDELNGYDCDYNSDMDHWFSGTCRYLDMYGIDFMFPLWNENGLFVLAESITHEGADDLKSIRENDKKYLRKMFVNRETTFEINFSGKVTMLIKLWDKPLSIFSEANYGDKKKIVDKLREVACHIDEYWGYRHYLDGSRNDDVEKYLAISEDAFNELEKDILA